MAGIINKKSTPYKAILAIGFTLLAIAIIWGVVKLVNMDIFPKVATSATSQPVNVPSWIATILKTVFGLTQDVLTIEGIVIGIAIFIIFFFAFSDIIEMFSTFSSTTSWVIGFGLAIICGVSGINKLMLNIVGITAGVGAIGVILIIIGTVASAVSLNLGLGGFVRRWRLTRQAEIEGFKTEAGTKRVTNAITALKETQKAYGGDETLK